jgi:hypothetical protein
VYTGSQSTSSLPRRLKLAVEKTNSNTGSTSNSVKHSSGTKVPTAAKPRSAGKIESDGTAMLEMVGRIEAGGKYDEEMEVSGGGGQKKKFSFVGLISEDMR